MLSADGDKPIAKSGQRNRKARRSGEKDRQGSRKSGQQPDPNPDQLQGAQKEIRGEIREQIGAAVSPGESSAADAPRTEAGTRHTESSPAGSGASTETVPVSVRTIANAYGEYTRKSLEQARSFFEQLAGVRSLDKALELQADFVKQACETFMTDAQRIRELQKELGKQNLERLEGLVPGMNKPR